MNRLAVLLFAHILLAIFPLRLALSQTVSIDVLVAIASDLSAEDAFTLSGEFEFRMTEIMLTSGMSSLHLNFRPYLLPAGYGLGANGTSGSVNNAATEVRNDIAMMIARDSGVGAVGLGITSYDLVVVLVSGLKDQQGNTICGYGPGPIDVPIEFGASESKFVAVVSNECPNREITLAHELGHLFNGDHQPPLIGECNQSVGEDCFPFFPVNYNHPVFNYDVGGQLVATSIMASRNSFPIKRQYSSKLGILVGTSGMPSGNSQSDMKRLIEEVWEDVAAYRPLPSQPSAPECIFTIDACFGSVFSAETLVTPQLPGYTVTNQLLWHDSGGTWQELYDGILNCVGVPSALPSRFRAILTTSLGSLSQCEIIVEAVECEPTFPW